MQSSDHVPPAHRQRGKDPSPDRSRASIGSSYTQEPANADRPNAQSHSTRHRNIRPEAADREAAHGEALHDQDQFLLAAVEALETLRSAYIACVNVTTHGVTSPEDRLIRRVCAAAGEMITSLTSMLGDCVICAVEVPMPPPAPRDTRHRSARPHV